LRERGLHLANWLLKSRSPSGRIDLDQVRRIVVIKPCCLGDMLMATPVIRALHQHMPGAELYVATGEWTQPAIETNPRLDGIIRYPDSRAILAAIQLGARLRRIGFDLGISLDRSPVPALAMRFAGIPIRAGIDSHQRGIGLTHSVLPESGKHESELYLSTLTQLGISDFSTYPEYHVPDEALTATRDQMPSATPDRPVVVIHPGGAVNPGVAMMEKRWPATSYGELASLLGQQANATVVLVGSESDRNAVDTVREFARGPVIDLCSQLSLDELAAIASRASLYVGNDSGTTHLASSVGTPVVAIFGPTSPRVYRPMGRRTRICAPQESWDLEPASDLRLADRAILPDIVRVPLPAVLNACMEMLKGSP
jgi:heptosyltransferase II